MATSKNVRVNGSGFVGGSAFGDITINGSGGIASGVTAAKVVVNGSGSAEGELTAESIVVNGSAKFQGPVHVGEVRVSGSTSIGSELDAGKLRVAGSLDVVGDVRAKDIDLQGELDCGGDCQAETLTGGGTFKIAGLLNVGQIDMRIYGQCRASEIGCERITVKAFKKAAWLRAFVPQRLTVDSIEGDDIVLEYTTAKAIRGHNVRLGTGCDVGVVEYTGTLVKADDAKVGEAKKQIPAQDRG